VTTHRTDFVPELRTDFERRDVGDGCVVWSPVSAAPAALDPIATVMLDVIDGNASVDELVTDVEEEIGVPRETAERQVTRVVEQFAAAGLLTSSVATSTADEAIAMRDLFVGPTTPCSENSSRLGTVSLNVRLGERTVRVTCDSSRGARTLRAALADHVVDDVEDAPLAFVLTAPQGFTRTHSLTDRSGFVLSEGRGLNSGLHALGSHLTALLPPASGVVRIRARALVSGEHTVLCLFPVLFFPVLQERDLADGGLRIIDRLALDIEPDTGTIANPPMPWPQLEQMGGGGAHLGTGGVRPITDVLMPPTSPGAGPADLATVVATIAGSGLCGSTTALLNAATEIAQRARVLSAPAEPDQLVKTLGELSATRT
jgi:hypothetical protein